MKREQALKNALSLKKIAVSNRSLTRTYLIGSDAEWSYPPDKSLYYRGQVSGKLLAVWTGQRFILSIASSTIRTTGPERKDFLEVWNSLPAFLGNIAWALCDTRDLAQSNLLAVFSVVGKETIAFFQK